MLYLLQYVRDVKLQQSCVRPTVMYVHLAMLHRIDVILKVNIYSEQRLPWPGSSNMKVDRMLKLPLLYASASPRHVTICRVSTVLTGGIMVLILWALYKPYDFIRY